MVGAFNCDTYKIYDAIMLFKLLLNVGMASPSKLATE